MTEPDLLVLASNLEAGSLDVESARKLVAAVPAKEPYGRQVETLIGDSVDAYMAGRTRRAWAAATIVDAVTKPWIEARSRPWPLRGSGAEGALDTRARALAVLSFLDADEGREESAATLRREADRILSVLRTPTPARFAISVTAAQRAIRLGKTAEAVEMLHDLLQLPSLNDSQRAAAQVVLAEALSAAGRSAESIAMLQASARSFHSAAMPLAALQADLERGISLMKSGDTSAARLLLAEVAASAVDSGATSVETGARLRLGLIASQAGEHSEAAEQFRLAAAAARRAGDDANVVVGLRNAADELRLQNDLEGAERLLNEALALGTNPKAAIDAAKAKYLFAVVRHEQGRQDDANHLLDEAAGEFQRKLDELGSGASPQAKEHLERQLREVALLRRKLSS
jgi:tetratricopeptide (TPR) repeat protein